MHTPAPTIVEELTDECITLTAYRDTLRTGKLQCSRAWQNYFAFNELSLPDGNERWELSDNFGKRLKAFCYGTDKQIFTFDKKSETPRNDLLARAGFLVLQKKFYFERSLENFIKPAFDFHYRSFEEIGTKTFAEILGKTAEGDAWATPDRDSALQELIDYAGNKFDPRQWFIVSHDGNTIGALLPQEFADVEHTGTLFYIGILPEFRGKGYGRLLHAVGLGMLAERGMSRYLGSTGENNSAMIRVFTANGCAQRGTQLFFGAM